MAIPPRFRVFAAKLLVFAVVCLAPVPAFANPAAECVRVNTCSQPTAPSAMSNDSLHVDLSDHEWEHRLLFVFSPSMDDKQWAQQRELWSGFGEGFEDRDLRMYVVGGKESGYFYTSPGGEARPIRASSAKELRDRFDVATKSYAVVLVGKDGTEKRRDRAPIDASAIFETIDAMPMRRAEMRDDG